MASDKSERRILTLPTRHLRSLLYDFCKSGGPWPSSGKTVNRVVVELEEEEDDVVILRLSHAEVFQAGYYNFVANINIVCHMQTAVPQ